MHITAIVVHPASCFSFSLEKNLFSSEKFAQCLTTVLMALNDK